MDRNGRSRRHGQADQDAGRKGRQSWDDQTDAGRKGRQSHDDQLKATSRKGRKAWEDQSEAAGRNARDEQAGVPGREQKRIRQWLKQVRFRKCLFGGVDERDVWKKIGELNDMYNAALIAERARYDALLEQQRGGDRQAQYSRFDTEYAGGERG